ncbi:tRNA uridine-5-carboxymethylaminomethyl(34) synthesis enzyme MnmG [Mycoplasma sp. SG1]|uniref:tRNA uridine-5-carboxymethylaminomethyl(34) synthesis enzyme MnmG n=1 Tax=Mycoplasma sp. SG1 TaxID=2810348 RepID=UPI0020243B15|nr:tRNA uridine-5-carboxymethylaminomethyl(34) synthesis enzyme MnmG [Mycoplasma sp. SG1]
MTNNNQKINNANIDVIVIGAGHAGVEAANIATKFNKSVYLFTFSLSTVATTPCNPSIGGSAKGIVVKEIDALGGLMGEAADNNILQTKILNKEKGVSIQSLRFQIDKDTYSKYVLNRILNNPKIKIIQDEVTEFLIKNNKIYGIKTKTQGDFFSKTVILTTGTYLKSIIFQGDLQIKEGPNKQKRSVTLSDQLKKYNFNLKRFKTGTPARILKNSINFSELEESPPDYDSTYFSIQNWGNFLPKVQEMCWITYTNEKTHKIIKDNIHLSPMYIDRTKGIGPRYCPSIEDKVMQFQNKLRHQIFLEPERKINTDIYLQGMSTCLPPDVQEQFLKTIKGLEHCKIAKYGYAIEYDVIDPIQLNPSLETKAIENLFTAGQINGTSGYEEAACQGLIAGINAALKADQQPPFILNRSDAYIGVLIDDIVTKGVDEPYRLLTSRAEHRLLLRTNNADIRLLKYASKYNLLTDYQFQNVNEKIKEIDEIINFLKSTKIKDKIEDIKEIFQVNTKNIFQYTCYDLLKNPSVNLKDLLKIFQFNKTFHSESLKETEINVKLEGYIKRQNQEIKNIEKFKNILFPKDFDFFSVPNISNEAKEKLNRIRPISLDQASRISGINLNDILILKIYIQKINDKINN